MSGTFESRKDGGLIEHSGLMCLDFDHLGVERLPIIKQQLIDDPYLLTVLLFRSPSGDGLKWVVEIDISRYSHLQWFRMIEKYLKEAYNLEVDASGKNVSRACFLPYDPDCYIIDPNKKVEKSEFDCEHWLSENEGKTMTVGNGEWYIENHVLYRNEKPDAACLDEMSQEDRE